MKVIIDGNSLNSDEIEKIKSVYESIIVSDLDIPIVLFKNAPDKKIVFITRTINYVKAAYKNVMLTPICIKIDSNLNWTLEDKHVYGKCLSVDDFLNGTIHCLLGEKALHNFTGIDCNFSYISFEEMYHWDMELNIYNAKVYSIGRYFTVNESHLDVYSSFLLHAKSALPSTKNIYKYLMEKFLTKLDYTFDHICYIPVKKGKENRFENLVDHNIIELKTNYNYDRNKSKEEKLQLLSNCFSLEENDYSNKKILIVDDVYTSGATLTAVSQLFPLDCNLTWLTFGITTHIDRDIIEYTCPNCKSRVKIKFNGITCKPFLGCSSFPNCRWSSNENFEELDFVYGKNK